VTARRIVSGVVTCLFVFLAFQAVRNGSLDVLKHLRLTALIAAAIVIFVGNNVLGGVRWWVLQGYRGSPASAVRALSESIFFATVLPTGSVGGDVYRGVRTHAAAPVVADRVVGAVVTAAFAAVCLPLFLAAPIWLVAITAALVVVFVYAFWKVVPSLRFGPPSLRGALTAFGELTARRRLVLPAALLTVGYLLCNTVFLLALAAAVGTHLTVAAALVGSPLVLACGVIPNVHGLSFVQVAIGAVLFHAGGTAAQASAAGEAHLLITYAFALGGGMLLLGRRISGHRMPLESRASEVTTR
jgi:Lysylphosphatidylglycerol synthase TM region